MPLRSPGRQGIGRAVGRQWCNGAWPLLWGVHCAAKGSRGGVRAGRPNSDLESPGTKAYTRRELDDPLASFHDRNYEIVFLGGDLLTFRPSRTYQPPLHKLAWKVYPRGLVEMVGQKLGHGTLIESRQ